MKTIEEIWLENVRDLVNQLYLGKNADLARAIDRSATLVSAYIGKNPRKKFGADMIRHIENSHNYPAGFLDREGALKGGSAAAVLLDRIGADFNNLRPDQQVELFERMQEMKRESRQRKHQANE